MENLLQLYHFMTDGVPSYLQTLDDVKWGVNYCLANCSGDFSPYTFYSSFKEFAVFDDAQADLLTILGLAVLWTLLRYILTNLIFKPYARWAKLTQLDCTKYPESAWKLLVYSCTWSLTCYVLFALPQNNHIFYEPDTLWDDYFHVQTGFPNHIPGMKVEPIVYWTYFIQLSFYVHSIYASLYMDAWRKDTILLIFHHFLTIALIGFSYVTRYHKIGLLVLFVHDPTDICLEFTKCNVYMKNRKGPMYKFFDALSTFGFVMFATTWYVFRLYWMPLKILHSTGYGAMKRHEQTQHLPFYFFFNIMLWILQGLNVYWFMFIVNFLIKVATGQMDEVDDIREEEVIKKVEQANSNGKETRTSPRSKSKKAD